MSAGNGPTNGPDEEDEAEDEQQAEEPESEQQDLEVVEEQNTQPVQPSEALEKHAVYEDEFGEYTIQILPQHTNSGTVWALWVFGSGQGPLLNTDQGITDTQAADFGFPTPEVQRWNGTLAKAQEELELPRSLRGQPRGRKTIEDLERAVN